MFEKGFYPKRWRQNGQRGCRVFMLDLQYADLCAIEIYHGPGISPNGAPAQGTHCIYGIRLSYQPIPRRAIRQTAVFGSQGIGRHRYETTRIHFHDSERIVKLWAKKADTYRQGEALSGMMIKTSHRRTFEIGDVCGYRRNDCVILLDGRELTILYYYPHYCSDGDVINGLEAYYGLKNNANTTLKLILANSAIFGCAVVPVTLAETYFTSVMGPLNGFFIGTAVQSYFNEVLFGFLYSKGKDHQDYLHVARVSAFCIAMLLSFLPIFIDSPVLRCLFWLALFCAWQLTALNNDYIYENLVKPLTPHKNLNRQEQYFYRRIQLEDRAEQFVRQDIIEHQPLGAFRCT